MDPKNKNEKLADSVSELKELLAKIEKIEGMGIAEVSETKKLIKEDLEKILNSGPDKSFEDVEAKVKVLIKKLAIAASIFDRYREKKRRQESEAQAELQKRELAELIEQGRASADRFHKNLEEAYYKTLKELDSKNQQLNALNSKIDTPNYKIEQAISAISKDYSKTIGDINKALGLQLPTDPSQGIEKTIRSCITEKTKSIQGLSQKELKKINVTQFKESFSEQLVQNEMKRFEHDLEKEKTRLSEENPKMGKEVIEDKIKQARDRYRQFMKENKSKFEDIASGVLDDALEKAKLNEEKLKLKNDIDQLMEQKEIVGDEIKQPSSNVEGKIEGPGF